MSGNGFKFEYTRALIRARKEWAKKDRSGNYLTVALAVYNMTDGDGASAYASAKRISNDTGIPIRTVERALKFLQDEELMHQDQRGYGLRDGTRRASVYSLVIPERFTDLAADGSATRAYEPVTSEFESATRVDESATRTDEPATNVADYQILSTTPGSPDPFPLEPLTPHPANDAQDDCFGCKALGDPQKCPVHNSTIGSRALATA